MTEARGLQAGMAAATLIAALAALALGTPAARAQTGTLIPDSTLYPRVIRLAHSTQNMNGMLVASTGRELIQRSADGGASWTVIGHVPVVTQANVTCCATLYEMPQTIGALAAGTLLFALTDGTAAKDQIEIFSSADDGVTWKPYDTPVLGGPAHYGVFEPEFTIGAPLAVGGAPPAPSLIMYYSDETRSGANPVSGGCGTVSGVDYCQKLSEIRTFDGVNWSAKNAVLASLDPGDRPGMARVSRLADGRYFMTYEFCRTIPNGLCVAHYRFSPDGWNFDVNDIGTPIVTPAGEYFSAAPTNALIPIAGLPSGGAIVVTGQHMYTDYVPNATPVPVPSPVNGDRIMVTFDPEATGPGGAPAATWYTLPAPVEVPDNLSEPPTIAASCPNYSSTLLPLFGSAPSLDLLELASDGRPVNGVAHCAVYSGSLTGLQLLQGFGE